MELAVPNTAARSIAGVSGSEVLARDCLCRLGRQTNLPNQILMSRKQFISYPDNPLDTGLVLCSAAAS